LCAGLKDAMEEGNGENSLQINLPSMNKRIIGVFRPNLFYRSERPTIVLLHQVFKRLIGKKTGFHFDRMADYRNCDDYE